MLLAHQAKGVTSSCPGDMAPRPDSQAQRIHAAVLTWTGKEQGKKDPASIKGIKTTGFFSLLREKFRQRFGFLKAERERL